MRQFIFVLLCFSSSFGFCQTNKINTDTIWQSLYPDNTNFDNENRLIRKVTEDGEDKEYRTELSNIFYYKNGNSEKATVILFSYDFSSGSNADCHHCFPKMEIATFAFVNKNWVKIKFIEGWTEAQGDFGEAPKVKFQNYNNINCLVTIWNHSANGNGDYLITSYYNIETLKEIKTISKKIDE